jgi:hypothetical protein
MKYFGLMIGFDKDIPATLSVAINADSGYGVSIMDIKSIIDALKERQIRITDHADEECTSDRLTFDEVYFSVLYGEIIEDYPDDKPYPSCLVYGRTFSGDPVHSVWAFNAETQWAVLITVYRPDCDRWIDFRQRRKRS